MAGVILLREATATQKRYLHCLQVVRCDFAAISNRRPPRVEGAVNTGRPPIAYRREITPDYLKTMKVPLLRGRGFAEQDDAGHPLAVLIDDRLAQRFSGDPIGQRLK